MTLADKVTQFGQDADTVHAIVHGPAAGAGSTVTTEGGVVRSFAKINADMGQLTWSLGNRPVTAYDTFSRADGPINGTSHSEDGQTYLVAGDNANTLFSVVNGKAAQGGGIPANFGNGYMSLDAGAPVENVFAEWTYEPGDSGSIVAVVITADNDLSKTHICHWITSDIAWNMQYSTTGPAGIQTIASGTYAAPLVGDGVTRYRVEMSPDVNKKLVTLRLPDGSTAVIKNPAFTSQIIGSRPYWQVIKHSATEKDPRFTSIGAHTRSNSKPFAAAPGPKDIPLALDALNAALRAALVPRQTLTFTPNATGWWRVYDLAGLNILGGEFRVSSPAALNANITDLSLSINVSAFASATGMAIQQTRYCSFQGGAVSQARVGNDASNHLYLDLFVSAANVPITVDAVGVQVPPAFSTYVPSPAAAAPTVSRTLALGHGFRTTDSVYAGGASLAPASITFTPNATGWWRIYDLAGLNIFSGNLQITSPASLNANITDVDIDVDVTAFSPQGMAITEKRYSSFQNGAVSQARVGSDGSNHLYVDINVSAANIPITVTAAGVQIPSGFASYVPAVAASTPTNTKTLTLGYGLRTTGPLSVGTELVTATANVNTGVLLTEIDATAGNVTLTLPTSTTVPGHKHTFVRVDNSANTVSIVGFFSDGTTSKAMTNAAGLTVIASSAANRWALAK